jgi:hypothetical protein
MRSETIARLTSEQFGKIAGALDGLGETNIKPMSDDIACGGNISETGCR